MLLKSHNGLKALLTGLLLAGCTPTSNQPAAATDTNSAATQKIESTSSAKGAVAGLGHISGILAIDFDESGPQPAIPVQGALVGIEGRPASFVASDHIGAFNIAIDVPGGGATETSNESTGLWLLGDPPDKAATGADKAASAAAETSSLPFTIVATFEKDGVNYAKRLNNVVLFGGRSLDLGTLSLSETGSIAGSVQLSDGASVLGTDVYIPGTSFVAKTAADGSFIILYVPEGTYDLVAERPGYAYATRTSILVLSKKVAELEPLILRAKDLTPPSVTITSGPEVLSNANVAVFELVASEPGARFICKLDNAPFSPCPSSAALLRIAEGPHVFEALATDGAGNTTANAASWRWTVDLTAPSVTLGTRPEPVTASSAATVQLIANEGGVTYSCLLDGHAYAPCSDRIELNNVDQGFHVLIITPTDRSGNAGRPVNISWRVDLTSVDTSLVSRPPELSNSTAATIVFTANKPATFACVLDGSPSAPCTSPISVTGLASGSHTVTITATDDTGRTEQHPLMVTWVVDSQPPTVAINAGPDPRINLNFATFELVANEGGAKFECKIDNASFSSCPASMSVARLGEGEHTFESVAIDAAGNRSSNSSTWRWTVDLTPPVLLTVSKPDPVAASVNASIEVASTEANVTYSCILDGIPYFPCTALTQLSSLSQGYHSYSVTAVDQAGNVSRPINVTWQIDLTVIDTTLITGPSSLTQSSAATLVFMANKPATFSCSLDAGPSLPCLSPATWTNLVSGSHEVIITATDIAGRIEVHPLAVTWTVDNFPPATPTLQIAQAMLTNDVTPELSWDAISDADHYRIEVDTSLSFNSPLLRSFDGTKVTSQEIKPQLIDGAWYVRVRAIDLVGNHSDWSSTHSFTVDSLAPEAPVSGFIPDPFNDTRPVFSWGAVPEAARYRLQISTSSSFATPLIDTSTTSNTTYTPESALPLAAIYWRVAAIDGAGNQSGYSVTRNFVIDTTAPGTPVPTAVPSPASQSRPTLRWSSVTGATTYHLQVSLDASFNSLVINDASIMTTSFTSTANLPDSNYYWRISAIDAANNESGFSAPQSFIIDTTAPPSPALTAYTPSPTNNLMPTLTWSNPGAGAISFDIEISQYPTFSTSIMSQAALSQTTFKPSTPLPIGAIYWRVRARDAAGNVSAYPSPSSLTLTSGATWGYKFLSGRSALSASYYNFSNLTFGIASGPAITTFRIGFPEIYWVEYRGNNWSYVQTPCSVSSPLGDFYLSTNATKMVCKAGTSFYFLKYNEATRTWAVMPGSGRTLAQLNAFYNSSNYISGFMDSGSVSQVILNARDPYANANDLVSFDFNSATQVWSPVRVIANSSMNPQIPFYPPLFAAKSDGTPGIFYLNGARSLYEWRELSGATWVSRGEIAVGSENPFLSDGFIYDSGLAVVRNTNFGKSIHHNGSQLAVTNTISPRYRLVNYGPISERDTYLQYYNGTSLKYFPIEDDNGTVLTTPRGSSIYRDVVINPYGNPVALISNLSTENIEIAPAVGRTTVDVMPGIGQFVSAALSSQGYPHIAYYDSSSRRLKLASQDATGWNIQTVDGTYGVGKYTSIGIKSSGQRMLAYYDEARGLLKLATEGAANTWTISTVDGTDDVGRYASLAIRSDGYPVIAYYDDTNRRLKLATFSASGANIEVVDSGSEAGQYASLKLNDSNQPRIAYSNAATGALKMATWTGSNWLFETVETPAAGVAHVSLALKPDGNPAIAYYSAGPQDLRFAEKSGTSWVISTPAAVGDVGKHASLAYDSNGNPHICHYDATQTNLMYGNRDSGIWKFRVIDGEDGDQGQYCGISINPRNGAPSAAYYDASNGGIVWTEGMVLY